MGPVLTFIAALMQIVLGVAHLFVSDRPALAMVKGLGADAYWQTRLKVTLYAGSITRVVIGVLMLLAAHLLYGEHVELARWIVVIAAIPPAISAAGIAITTPRDAPKAISHAVVVILAVVGAFAGT